MRKTNSHNDVSTALSYESNESLNLHVSPVPLGMKTAYDCVVIVDDLHARWKSLEQMKIVSIVKHHKAYEITLYGQTVWLHTLTVEQLASSLFFSKEISSVSSFFFATSLLLL